MFSNSQTQFSQSAEGSVFQVKLFQLSSFLYPHIILRSSNIWNHIFTCILHLLWVYYELTKWSAPRWLDSSVGIPLHPYRRGHEFDSHSGLNLFSGFNFTAARVVCITVMIISSYHSPQFRYRNLYIHLYLCGVLPLLHGFKPNGPLCIFVLIGRPRNMAIIRSFLIILHNWL